MGADLLALADGILPALVGAVRAAARAAAVGQFVLVLAGHTDAIKARFANAFPALAYVNAATIPRPAVAPGTLSTAPKRWQQVRP